MEAPPLAKIEVHIPRKLYEALERAEHELGIRKEDIVARALLKVLEELGVNV